MNRRGIHIGLNASMMDDQPTGVGVVSFNMINSLSYLFRKDKRYNLTVYSPSTKLFANDLRVVKLPDILQSSKHGKFAALCRFIWNTFYFPFIGRKFDMLFSPTTHGSMLLRNQIITIHDLLSLRYKNISFHQRIYFRYVLPRLTKKARYIVTVSDATKLDIINFLQCPAEKIKVIHNGYDSSVYYPEKSDDHVIGKKYGAENYFLVVGPTYHHKNIRLLLDAYSKLGDSLQKKHPLIIAGGKKSYLNFLKKYIRESGLEINVHFLGYIPMPLMPSLYREAFALVYPSLHEGFGLPLLEAMACGCPVICSGTSSMPEVCGNAAAYFDPYSMQSLTDALQKIIVDDEFRLDMKNKGIKQAQNFSWNISAQKLKNLIDKTCYN